MGPARPLCRCPRCPSVAPAASSRRTKSFRPCLSKVASLLAHPASLSEVSRRIGGKSMTYAALDVESDVNSTYLRSQTQSEAAQLANGNLVVVWLEADVGSTANQLLKAQIYGPDGSPFGGEITLVPGGGVNPSVAGLSDGGFVLTWQSF